MNRFSKSCVLAFGLYVAGSSCNSIGQDSVNSERSQVEIHVPEKTKTTVATLGSTVVQEEIIFPNLGGLEVIEDVGGVNLKDQFLVSPDGECVVQMGAEVIEGNLEVTPYIWGPRAVMGNPELIALDATEDSLTNHADPGVWAERYSKPLSRVLESEVEDYIVEFVDSACDALE